MKLILGVLITFSSYVFAAGLDQLTPTPEVEKQNSISGDPKVLDQVPTPPEPIENKIETPPLDNSTSSTIKAEAVSGQSGISFIPVLALVRVMPKKNQEINSSLAAGIKLDYQFKNVFSSESVHRLNSYLLYLPIYGTSKKNSESVKALVNDYGLGLSYDYNAGGLVYGFELAMGYQKISYHHSTPDQQLAADSEGVLGLVGAYLLWYSLDSVFMGPSLSYTFAAADHLMLGWQMNFTF